MNYKRFDSIGIEDVIHAYERMGYTLFTKGNFNLNIFGIRNQKDRDSEYFNDMIGLLYKDGGKWVLKKYDATTDPSIHYREEPMNPKGCAVLKEGFHLHGFRLGVHKGKYSALVQNVPLPLYRDNNRDSKLDYTSPVITEMAGINIHRAKQYGKSIEIGPHSAGCQVIADSNDFLEFMNIIKQSAQIYGDSFSYALFTEDQFFG